MLGNDVDGDDNHDDVKQPTEEGSKYANVQFCGSESNVRIFASLSMESTYLCTHKYELHGEKRAPD